MTLHVAEVSLGPSKEGGRPAPALPPQAEVDFLIQDAVELLTYPGVVVVSCEPTDDERLHNTFRVTLDIDETLPSRYPPPVKASY